MAGTVKHMQDLDSLRVGAVVNHVLPRWKFPDSRAVVIGCDARCRMVGNRDERFDKAADDPQGNVFASDVQ